MKNEKVIIFGAGAQAKYILETFSISKDFEVDTIIELKGNRGILGSKIYDVLIRDWDDDHLSDLIRTGVRKAIIAHQPSLFDSFK